MKWNILVELERRKHARGKVKDSAARGLGVMSVLLVLYLAFAESVGSSGVWQQVDKGMHFTMFGVFTFMFLQYARLKVFPKSDTWIRVISIFLFLSVLGFSAEIAHLFMPHRTFEWWDMAANFAGIFLIGIPVLFITPFRRNQNPFSRFDQARALRDADGEGLRLRQYARSYIRRR